MLTLADSHVHLDDVSFENDRAEVIAHARQAGVALQIVPGVDAASWPRIRALCTPGSGLFAAYGMHPMFMHRHRPDDLAALPHWLRTHRPVAVGEIGLDFYRDKDAAPAQRDFFRQQLALARQFELPVIVHARGALDEVILTLRRSHGLRGVVHSFAGSQQQAQQLWKLGFHIGIGGTVTYERAQRLRQIVAHMPMEHLLLESDAPHQPLAAYRGQRNEPARVADVLQCVAALRGEAAETVAAVTTANARRLFAISS